MQRPQGLRVPPVAGIGAPRALGATASFSSTSGPPRGPTTVGTTSAAAAADVRGKLWSITTEYENLLQIQNEHFEACIRAKDKTIDQLKNSKGISDPVGGGFGVYNFLVRSGLKKIW